jgi:hypothetical protein
MAKVVVKEIKEGRWKEKEDKSLKRVINLGIATNRTIQRVVEKCVLKHNLLQPILQ